MVGENRTPQVRVKKEKKKIEHAVPKDRKRNRRQALNTMELIIPKNEQDRATRTVESVKDSMVKRYLASLIHPKMNATRVPDSYPRPTALVRSITSVVVPVDINATNDSGRFAVAVQPHLGLLSSVRDYKIAITNPATVWADNDWSVAGSYLGVVGGRDVRVDQFYLPLTQPPLGAYLMRSSGAAPNFFHNGTAVVESVYNSGVRFVAGTADQFLLPPGQYLVAFEALVTGTVTNLVPTVAGGTIDVLNRQSSVDGTMMALVAQVTVPGLNGATFTLASTHTLTATASVISFTPTFYSAATAAPSYAINAASLPFSNGGLVQQLRTVGCSVLATYAGTTLQNGGMIAGAYVPGGALDECFFAKNPMASTGALQNWENLASVNGSYNGRLQDGAYVWWCPEDSSEIQFREPEEFKTQNAGTINMSAMVIAGQFQPGSGVSGVLEAVRLEVVTLYEVVTVSQLWASTTCVGSQAHMDAANLALADQPHAMANAAHSTWLKDFWGGLKKGLSYWEKPAEVLWNNKDKLLPLLGGL